MSSLHRFASLVEAAMRKPKSPKRKKFDRNRYVLDPLEPIRFLDQGLLAYFFTDQSLSVIGSTAVVPNIDYDWGQGSPDASIPSDGFSASFTGWLTFPDSGDYTLSVSGNEGFRLKIDGVTVIDHWSDLASPTGDTNNDETVDLSDLNDVLNNFGSTGSGVPGDTNGDGVVDGTDENNVFNNFGSSTAPATDSYTYHFDGGSSHFIELDFYENTGLASIELDWESDVLSSGGGGDGPVAIPDSQFSLPAPTAGAIDPIASTEGAPVTISTPFSDPTGSDLHATVDWGDTNTNPPTLDTNVPLNHATDHSGTLSASHTYTSGTGLYAATLTVTGPTGEANVPFTVAVTPAAPTGLSATAASPGEINLTWTDNSAIETGFNVYVSTDGGTTYSYYDSAGANATSYQATGLTPSTSYLFSVAASNDAGPSDRTAPASASTLAVPVPTNPTAIPNGSSATQVDLSWGAVTGATGYELEWSVDGGATYETLASVSGATTTYQATGLTPGTKYTFRMAAETPDGVSSWVVTSEQLTTSRVPTGFSATSSSSQINLKWDKVAGAEGYDIRRSTDNSTWTDLPQITSGSTISYTDSSASNNQKYYYQIRSYNDSGNSDYTSSVIAGQTPAAPSNLTASLSADGTVRLSWQDNSSNESGFYVQESWDGTTYFSTNVAANSTTFIYRYQSAPDQLVDFRVRAYNNAGVSEPTSIVPVLIQRIGQTSKVITSGYGYNPNYSGIRVQGLWDQASWYNATGFVPVEVDVERSEMGGPFSQIYEFNASALTESFIDTNVTPNVTYTYRLRTVDAVGRVGYSNTDSGVYLPASAINEPNIGADVTYSKYIFRAIGNPRGFDLNWSQGSWNDDGSEWIIGDTPSGGSVSLTISNITPHSYVFIAANVGPGSTGIPPDGFSSTVHVAASGGISLDGGDGVATPSIVPHSDSSMTIQITAVTNSATWQLSNLDVRFIPSVAITTTLATASDLPTPTLMTVTRTGPVDYAMVVDLHMDIVSNTQGIANHYEYVPSVVTIPVGSTSTTFALDTAPDIMAYAQDIVAISVVPYNSILSTGYGAGDQDAVTVSVAKAPRPNVPPEDPPLTLTAYRTGGRFGTPVSDDDRAGGDPAKYVILTNNNYDEDFTGDRKDYDDATALIGTDTDLAKITLHQLPSNYTSGTASIVRSDASAVRLFKSDGSVLNDLTLNLASPSGDLAALLTGDMDVWVEGLKAKSDFALKYSYKRTDGVEVARDAIHMNIVDWTFVGQDGTAIGNPASMLADAISAHAAGTPDPAYAGYGAFLPKLNSLPPLATNDLTFAAGGSTGTPSPFNAGTTIDPNGEFLTLTDSGTTLTSEDKALIKSTLGLDVVQANQVDFTLALGPTSSPTDVFTRSLKANQSKVLIGADDATDESLHDDWVGANGDVIQNFLQVKDKPNTTISVTLTVIGAEATAGPTAFLSTNNPTGASAKSLSLSVTTDANGLADTSFFITGGLPSVRPEDLSIQAVYGAQVIAAETLTILDLKFFEETGGVSPIPLNPAIVTAAAPAQRGNLFGVGVDHVIGETANPADDNLMKSSKEFAKIELGKSKKISPDKIEVLWARTTAGVSYTDSATNPAALEVAPTVTDLTDGIRTGFRMRDHSLFLGVPDGQKVTYYIAHPTSAANPLLKADNNYAAKIDAEVRTEKVYKLNIHLLKGPTLDSGVTAPQIASMVTDLNTIWSQAGIRFNLTATTIESVDDADMKIYYYGYSAFFGDQGTITKINNQSDSIDAYFVSKVYDDSAKTFENNAGTVVFNPSGSDLAAASPGVILAGQSVGYSADPAKKQRQMTRTLAHEIGHYLLDQGDEAHVHDRWNVMRGGEREEKRDINTAQINVIDNHGPSTTSPDF